jgi:hypothetical protein
MKIATFTVDVTPPIGNPIAFGINEKMDSPIYVRGAVIDDGQKRIVLASADFIYIWGKAHEQMKKMMAKAAGTVSKNVFLHSIHQHDSVRISLELNEVFKKYKGVECTPLPYYKEINERLKESIEAAVGRMRKVKCMATAERRISGLASNRRLLDENGKVYAMRYSRCTDPKLQKESIGIIDPTLRSIGFIGRNNEPVAIMHFYASHPMTAYGRNMVGADVPGVALDYLKKHSASGKDTLNIYFTGCGGNVTFGKYSISPPQKSLRLLGERLGKALLANCNSLEEKPMGLISLKHSRFEFPLDPQITEEAMLKKIEEAKEPNLALRASTHLTIKKNWDKWKTPCISRISFGQEINMLSIPAETVVEYQLYAQSLVPEKFLACTAYGNGIYHYIPTKAMYDEGGYEPEYGAVTTAEVEEKMKKAIYESLKDLI